MKVLIIGANGQLGSDLVTVLRSYQKNVVGLTHQEIEVTDPDSVKGGLELHRPDLVINTAAYHKVDEVELNPERAFAVNAIAPWRMAQICAEKDISLLFVSTDYVFGAELGRTHPYSELDIPGPINVYGASKLAGENLVRYACPKHFIIRTSGLYGVRGASGKGGNFVETMLRLAREEKPVRVVNDQCLTPTFTVDLAHAVNAIIDTDQYGLYHVTNEGYCTWYEFANQIFELAGLNPALSPVSSSAFNTAARRPSYSVLSKDRFSRVISSSMRPWSLALSDYLRSREMPGSRS